MSEQKSSDTLEDEIEFDPSTMDAGGWGEAAATGKAKNFWGSAGRMISLLTEHRSTMVIVVLLGIVGVVLTVIAPRIIGEAIDVIAFGISSPSHQIDFGRLGVLIGQVLAMYFIAYFFMWFQGWLLNRLTMKAMYSLREQIEAKINRLPLSYFDTRQRGDVMSRVTNDVDNIQAALQQAFSQVISTVLQLIGIIVMMFVVSWQLAIVVLLSLPLMFGIMALLMRSSQKSFTQQWKSTGALNGHVEESFSGLDLVRVYGRDKEMLDTFDQRNNSLASAAFRAQRISGAMMPTTQFVSYLSYVLIAVVGAYLVINRVLTLGAVVAFIQYSREFNQPLAEFSGLINMFQSGVASAERTFELLDAEEEKPDQVKATLPARVDGNFAFTDVSFSYDPETSLIEHLNLAVAPGRTVAIVGPTGAGKTTLVNLIMRFYEIDSGEIALDGRNTADLARGDLRSKVGMVLQDTWLFEGTIRDNIRFGRLEATDEEVVQAAEAAMVDRFVRQLPDGYDTVVSNEGGSLSSGERQLITIARAFIAQPSLLILDEATSSVDTRTEVLVQKAMAALRADRTSFVIAHRLSTIRDADTILVMENGTIVESGSHDELLNHDGPYRRLYQAQFESGIDDSDAVANPDAPVNHPSAEADN